MTNRYDLARRLLVADADVRAVDWINGACYVTLADGTVRLLNEDGYEVVDRVPEAVQDQVGVADTVPEGNTTVLIEWVAGDPGRARQALDEELQRDKPRKGLVAYLERVLT